MLAGEHALSVSFVLLEAAYKLNPRGERANKTVQEANMTKVASLKVPQEASGRNDSQMDQYIKQKRNT